jgi:hypothetical protein
MEIRMVETQMSQIKIFSGSIERDPLDKLALFSHQAEPGECTLGMQQAAIALHSFSQGGTLREGLQRKNLSIHTPKDA